MSTPNKSDEWIEQFFSSNVNFNQNASGVICCNGLGVDQIIFQFILPELPKDLKYKSFCVYELIRSIEIQIGGQSIIRLHSNELRMMDTAIRNFENIKKCSTTTNNIILYPFDLGYFFKESRSDDAKLTGTLPLDFKGIRLVDLDMHEVRVFIDINAIDDIIIENPSFTNYDDLHKLCLVDSSMMVHYVKILNKNLHCYLTIKELQNTENTGYSNWLRSFFANTPSYNVQILNTVENPELHQKICTWTHETNKLNNQETMVKLRIIPPMEKMSKVVMYSEKLNKISHFILYLNGHTRIHRNRLDHYKKIYEYNNKITLDDNIFVFDVDISQGMDNITLGIWFTEPCNDLEIDLMYDDNYEILYENKKFIRSHN
jgi:hypothetical protein